ncbi:type IIL restriction-modification enzyme MmeI [Flavobacterium sp.]|uniref:type IIL restriction-modification enzyme MmeI n=1 Tax=Flavobacterium sp. TaxID=239 RepID=UPI0039E4D68B
MVADKNKQMSLFQQSVLEKYLKLQDDLIVEKAYKKFTKYFENPVIQQNIRNSKEEQFQEGFLRELFVNVLGYTLNPNPKFNLTSEFKNLGGAKKADGAILKSGKAIGVIELKGTNTKDLENIRRQAFDYKANHVGCIYVITSNFEKLRFYINNAVEFLEFNLFTIGKSEFKTLYLCLAAENIFGDLPLKIKQASIVEEKKITNRFYADYSLFKRELYRDLVRQNANNSLFRDLSEKNFKLTLFKKSQKLIDRFLFILFAEDSGLLSPNTITEILSEWTTLVSLDEPTPLYERYKKYFNYLDTGRKGTTAKDEIFAYNGGLFEPDAILNSILIDDDLLYRHTKHLTTYHFKSQVDVNILGHIFENSLNEIESINAEIEDKNFDKQTSKRKKDGVFYTPKYITKYIVDNTVGKLCKLKKIELGINEEDYAKGRKNRHETTILKLNQQLKDYREWLLNITICDPACGSGAFLNQALDFLIAEHKYLDELNKSLFGGFIVFPDIENQILEKKYIRR